MKHARIILILLCLALLAGALPAAAQGIILPPPGVETDPSWLKIDYQRVNVSIENQIATTHIDMQFTNEGQMLAEGTFLFPLPRGAAVDRLTMHVNGLAIDAKILPADEARQIYNSIVQQYLDPALLEYVGQDLIQASIFPIPPGESRRIEIEYGQVLEADNGLVHYVFPMHTAGSSTRSIGQMSLSVQVTSADPISSVYSPSHSVAINREGDYSFRAGFEQNNFVPGDDFSLYYAVASDFISLNLLTYRESADQDGFFMLLVQPPISVPEERIAARDVIIVLDQSGSMSGQKWDQARDAAAYVLQNLQEQDRFNIISFSTGWRIYAPELLPASESAAAVRWLNGLTAEGGTDINGSLLAALEMAHVERPTTILFLTDGQATEGVTATDSILANLRAAARSNVRIFAFGVGDDVNTLLLDGIVRDHRGTSVYVRPGERIDEKVASLYTKISAPVLNDVTLEISGVQAELLYPAQLPDLFAGEQLTIVGRYRGSASGATITLRGSLGPEAQSYIYSEQLFPATAGGEPFIARLWATRRIGDLLNTIRLQGENSELVSSIITLSLRYGIITPYTSFLIEEDDILTSEGMERAIDLFEEEAADLSGRFTGSAAVDDAQAVGGLSAAEAPAPAMAFQSTPAAPGADQDAASVTPLQTVGDKTFILRDGVWTDTSFMPDVMETQEVLFLSDAYFDLLEAKPELAQYFALGQRVIVLLDGVAYEVVTE